MSCKKTVKKIPMAAVGLADLALCTADKAICSLAKRGEKAVEKMKKAINPVKDCCSDASPEHP